MTLNISLAQTMLNASRLLPAFEKAIKMAPYENKGVLFSEMLFVLAAVNHLHPKRIFESGRARGVSTYLLGKCFTESLVVSVEYDAQSPDVSVAAANLEGMNHVECLFGDAQIILPQRVKEDDIVVIDGPKHFRALRLAFHLLRDQKATAVLVHDSHLGSCERDFLSQHVPHTFYSDDERFVEAYKFLDKKCWDLRKDLGCEDFPAPFHFRGKASSYGPTFACIAQSKTQNWTWQLIKLNFLGIWHRLFKRG